MAERPFHYYRFLAARTRRIRRLARHYADGLLDYLDEEEFPHLRPAAKPTVAPTTPIHDTSHMIERAESTYSEKAAITVYARNSMTNKGRYPRNRQTYRTGVL